MKGVVRVRPLTQADVPAAAELHRRALSTEFLARCGLAFMLTYYRAWTKAPGSISLAAVDDREYLLGVILGATDPAGHVRAMVRRNGLRIAARLAAYALGHPALAKELIVTRGRRYARGITRIALIKLRRPSLASVANTASDRLGELTHLFVQPDSRGLGIGRALVEAAVETARAAGVGELVLVTPPDFAARDFYEHLGWSADGEMSSRSGEIFIRYRLSLFGKAPKGADPADAGESAPINC